MNNTVPKAELLERERRWSPLAGIAALLGAGLAVASVAVIQSVGSSDTDAESLADVHDHASAVILRGVLEGMSWLLFAVALVFLFFAAAGRSDLVRRPFLYLAVLGSALLLAGGILAGVGAVDAADQFAEERPALEEQTREEQAQQDQQRQQDGSEDAGDEEDTPLEDRAEDVLRDNGAYTAGQWLGLPGILAMLAALIYIPLWSMRTGLLTRFWATLGMALAVGQVILGDAGRLGLLLWFAVIGLMLLGFWPGARPPAWDAGEAVPWSRPGAPPPEAEEGSGREISERPLPEAGADQGEEQAGAGGVTQGQRRKKRKRRD